jgi:hypothetical protein
MPFQSTRSFEDEKDNVNKDRKECYCYTYGCFLNEDGVCSMLLYDCKDRQ